MAARPPHDRRPGSAPQRAGSAPTKPDPGRTARVVAVLDPAVRSAGLELEDVEMRAVGRRLVLRVLVDSDHGVTLDEVAVASRAVSDALDTSDVLGDEPYTLEVSSPGVDRPLTLPRHWQRNVGRLVAVTRADGRDVAGRLVSVNDDAVELEVNLKGRITRSTVPLADVRRAVVQVEFSRVADADLGDDTGVGSDDDPVENDENDDPVESDENDESDQVDTDEPDENEG
jgi:ribosome maturation factor RimP